MKTEIEKTFTYRFILTEQELVRINDVIMQQMKTATTGTKEDIKTFFELSFKNGIIAERASLDEVIAENNINQWEIQTFKIGVYGYRLGHPQKTRIEVGFRTPPLPENKNNTQHPPSIFYYVLGYDRNWVYLTSSQLDDRITKVKTLPVDGYGKVAIVIGVSIALGLIMLSSSVVYQPLNVPLGYRITSFLASGLMIIGGIAAIYGFPPYNFYWGDYAKKYSTRRKVGQYVINGVIVTLVISIIGGIIDTLFFLR